MPVIPRVSEVLDAAVAEGRVPGGDEYWQLCEAKRISLAVSQNRKK